MNIFSERIKEMRVEKGLSQIELAEKLGVATSTVGMWETGKRYPSTELYEAIADYFDVDIDYLYGRTNIKKKIHIKNDNQTLNYVINTGKLELTIENSERFSNIERIITAYRKLIPEDQAIIDKLIDLIKEESDNEES